MVARLTAKPERTAGGEVAHQRGGSHYGATGHAGPTVGRATSIRSTLKLALEGASTHDPGQPGKTAERLAPLKETGLFHAIVAVQPAPTTNAAPMFDAFASKHLAATRTAADARPGECDGEARTHHVRR